MILERKQLRKLINEAIYGKTAIVYHGSRTPPVELIKSYNSGGFQPGGGAGGLYGMGLYTVYDDKDLFVSNTGTGSYGPYVYKFKTNLNNFLALNEDTCKLVHGKVLTVRQQLEKMQNVRTQISDIENSKNAHLLDASLPEKDVLSGGWAKVLSVFLMNDIVGMLFRGSNDGYVCLIFDDANTFPVAHTTVDEIQAAGTIKNVNWKRIDKSSIKNVLKRSATTTARPGKFISNNLRDRSKGIGLTELELSNVEVFLKRYQGLKKYIKINADVIQEEGYHYLKQKVLSSFSVVDGTTEDQYKKYALEILFFEKALSTASTLQGIINVIEFDDVFDDAILGDRFGQETIIGNRAKEKAREIIRAKYKSADVETLGGALLELRISPQFVKKTKGLYQSTGSFNITATIIAELLSIVKLRKDSVDILSFANRVLPVLKKLGEKETIRVLSNELYYIFGRESEKAGKEAANKINSGVKPANAIINAVNNNRLLSVVMRYMRNASKALSELIVSMANLTYGMDGVTKPGEYAMFLVLIEAFKKVDKEHAMAAYNSLGYFLNKRFIPSESVEGLIDKLRPKLR